LGELTINEVTPSTKLTNGADVVTALHGCKRMYFGMSVSPPYLQATAIAAAATKEIPPLSLPIF